MRPWKINIGSVRLRAVFPVAAVFAAALVVFLFDPEKTSLYPKCLFHLFTGWYCPGCGALRASHALLHGEIIRALDFNPLFVLLAPPLAGYLLISGISSIIRGRPLPPLNPPFWMGVVLVITIILFSIIRNMPQEPFSILAP